MFDLIQHLINRGQQANALLKNPAYTEAVETVRQQYIDMLIATKLGDSDTRERCYMAIRALGDVNLKLDTFVSNAKYEEGKLSQPQNGANL